MFIKEVSAKKIKDSRNEDTISVSIKTNVGSFSASSPNGKSKGKFEEKSYKKTIEEDIKKLKEFSDYFSDDDIKELEDLRLVEDIADGHIGANTFFALESAVLRAIAKEQKKEIWQLINPKAKNFPGLVGNCIGGGKHSNTERKPDFQEFLLIPKSTSVIQSFDTNRGAKINAQFILKNIDKKFNEKKNDEDTWVTSLDDKTTLEVLKDLKDNVMDERKLSINLGIDAAASTFYSRKKYKYLNPKLERTKEEQLWYLTNLIKNFNLFYIEDPFEENDFDSFSKLLKKFPNSLIVGDDLTVTNSKRLEKAIENKSINGVIVKPNQCGSLLEVKRVCELAKKNNIRIIFSHRSGETEENILADLAFGFQADFFKCGIDGKERETKLQRLMEIEKNFAR